MKTSSPPELRMKDVVAATGLAPSAVHYYVREGLVPPGKKLAQNSAVYGSRHVERLRLIQTLRTEFGLAIDGVRRALRWIDRGVDPRLAVELEREVVGASGADDDRFDLGEAARRAEVPVAFVEQLLGDELVLPARYSDGDSFDAADVAQIAMLARAYDLGVSPDEASQIAAHLRAASEIELAARNRLVEGQGISESLEISRKLQRASNLMHAYMFSRLRRRQIDDGR